LFAATAPDSQRDRIAATNPGPTKGNIDGQAYKMDDVVFIVGTKWKQRYLVKNPGDRQSPVHGQAVESLHQAMGELRPEERLGDPVRDLPHDRLPHHRL
jgi:hypothetical protein